MYNIIPVSLNYNILKKHITFSYTSPVQFKSANMNLISINYREKYKSKVIILSIYTCFCLINSAYSISSI